MKVLNTKSVILRPLLVGVVGLLAGAGLFVYYYFYAKDPSKASFFISALVFLVGLVAFISTIGFAINQMLKLKALKLGKKVEAEYLSNNTKVKSTGTNYYFIEYKYSLDGVEYKKVSPSEFIWKEVLTLKAVKKFDIRVYKNRVVLDCDLEKLFEENKEQVKIEEQKYEEAYKTVDSIINKP